MSLTIKVFWEKKKPDDVQIRRFGVPADAASSYAYMFKKISEVFPDLGNGNFSLFWKDLENDVIQFSSDEELLEALGYVEGSVFKVFVKDHSAHASADGPLHPGVICDGCELPLQGIRYKCFMCPDYDLCAPCEAKGIHSEHEMLKIPTPRDHPHGHPEGAFMPPPHFRRWMHRFMRRWHNKNGPEESGFAPFDQWTETPQGASAQDDSAPKAAGKCEHGQEDCCAHGKCNKCELSGDGEGAEKYQNKDGKCCYEPEEGTGIEEDFLRHIGEGVRNLLDPIGIDVDVDVDVGGRQQNPRARGGRRGRGRGGCGPMGSFWNMFGQGGWGGHHGYGRGGGQGFGRGGRGCPARGGRGGCKRGEQGKEAKQAPATDQPMETKEAPMNVDEVQQQATAPPVENLYPKITPEGDSDWTLLNQSEQTDGGPSAQPPLTEPATGPSVHPPRHPDTRIANALDQMLAMGFNNEGGWLTNLLEAKNGDIFQVLDAIRPGGFSATGQSEGRRA